VCDNDIPSFRWRFHLDYPAHLRLLATQSVLDRAADRENDVKVSGETGGIDFGVVDAKSVLRSSSLPSQIIKISKTNVDARIRLDDFRLTLPEPVC
jgi:hypothetical protein